MINLTTGNPTKQMLKFALPVCFGNIFQLFYSLADTRIVGSTLGETSLAAVGATTSISTLLIGVSLWNDKWFCYYSGTAIWKKG